MHVCFSFSQEIGWEECLRNDLFCVSWYVKPELNQFHFSGFFLQLYV